MSFMLLGILNSQAAGGGGGAFDLLETTTLTTSASSVTFSGLGAYSGYKHLQVRAVARTLDGGTIDGININLNGISAGNAYAKHELRGSGSSVTSRNDSNQNELFGFFGVPGNTATANAFGCAVIDILDFSSSNQNTTLRALGGFIHSSGQRVQLISGLFNSTNAVTSIFFEANGGSNLAVGTRFSLYGVK